MKPKGISSATITDDNANDTQSDPATGLPEKRALFNSILRHFIAYDISLYGFAKIFGNQFPTVYSRNDLPVGGLSGYDLTWNYFGYSHAFAVILGLAQISGGILLLFKRTTLLGTCILLPIIVNIVLINLFFGIAAGAELNAFFITLGLLYLLFLRWRDIKAIFFGKLPDSSTARGRFSKPLIKLLPLAIVFSGLFVFLSLTSPAVLAGKWRVQQLIRNGRVVNSNDWLVNPNSWCCVYIETRGDLYLSPNPYIFDRQRALHAAYKYEPATHLLQLTTARPATQKVAVSNYNGHSMQWNTILGHDTVQLKLVKESQNL
jgi:hypothetical protein